LQKEKVSSNRKDTKQKKVTEKVKKREKKSDTIKGERWSETKGTKIVSSVKPLGNKGGGVHARVKDHGTGDGPQ